MVDDQPLNLEILGMLLMNQFNVELYSASNGKVAIDEITNQDKEGGFKIVFMDCYMPIMDGFEASQEIKRLY